MVTLSRRTLARLHRRHDLHEWRLRMRGRPEALREHVHQRPDGRAQLRTVLERVWRHAALQGWRLPARVSRRPDTLAAPPAFTSIRIL